MSSHSAMIYRGTDEFVSGVSRFVREGIGAGDRVLVLAPAEKLHRLERELGVGAGMVDLHDADDAYRPQARAIQMAMTYLDEQPARRTRLVAEQRLTERNDVELAAYVRQEAAANALYQSFPVGMLCPYDADTVPGQVLTACRKTHGGLLEGDRLLPNAEYVEPRTYLTESFTASATPPSADVFTCETVDDLATARQLVQGEAVKAQLGWDTTGDLVLAVNEVLTNAITHGRPPARLSVYRDGPALACHVHDLGHGLTDPLVGYFPPPQEPTSGRGLWLARQLCDSVEIGTDDSGSHVRLLMLPSS
ncbi:MAG: anti-sigma factor RsbA family regulatory protein [Nocardioidaceae bacterium]